MQPSSREEAMYSTRVVVDVIECLNHRNSAVRSKADKITELVLEFDRNVNGEPGQLGGEIIRKRFESYNRVWIQAVNQQEGSMYTAARGGDDRLRSYQEEEMNMINSARYFNDKVAKFCGYVFLFVFVVSVVSSSVPIATVHMQIDNSMEYYKMNKPSGGYTGDEYKQSSVAHFADSVDDSGDSWQHHYK